MLLDLGPSSFLPKEIESSIVTIGTQWGEICVPPIVQFLLKDSESNVRIKAVDILKQIGGYRVVEPLIAALKDSNSSVRFAVVCALGQIGGSVVIEPLIDLLKDDWQSVRKATVNALGQIATGLEDTALRARIFKSLKIMIEDNDRDVREAAAKTLDNLGMQPGNDKKLKTYLTKRKQWETIKSLDPAQIDQYFDLIVPFIGDKDLDVRKEVFRRLGNSKNPHAIELLLDALPNYSIKIRKTIANSLQVLGWTPENNTTGAMYWAAMHEWWKCSEMGDIAIQTLIESLDDESRTYEDNSKFAFAIKSLGSTFIDKLTISLTSDSHTRRQNAVEVLGILGDTQAIPALKKMLSDSDKDVVISAAEALYKFHIPNMDETLQKIRYSVSRFDKVGQHVWDVENRLGIDGPNWD